MGCCQSKWRRHEQPTDQTVKPQREKMLPEKKVQSNQMGRTVFIRKSEHSGIKSQDKKSTKTAKQQAKKVQESSFGLALRKDSKSQRRPTIEVEVIEPSVTHSDFIHQLEVKESVPTEIFANMNNLDDCFQN